MVGLDALPTERCFQQLRRLNHGLSTSHWKVYEHKRETDRVCLVLSIDSPLIAAWDRRYSFLSVKPKGRK